jgi:hypothetical protein
MGREIESRQGIAGSFLKMYMNIGISTYMYIYLHIYLIYFLYIPILSSLPVTEETGDWILYMSLHIYIYVYIITTDVPTLLFC